MRFTEYNSDGLLRPSEAAFLLGEGVPGTVAETWRPYMANHPVAGTDPGARNLVNVPILSREGALLGCLEVHNKRRGESFDEADVSMLEGLASSAAVALENARLLYEQVQAEADLRQLKEFNEDIIQSMGEGIVVQDRLGRFTFVNPAAAAMLGYAPEELLGEPWSKVVPLDQHAIVQEVDAQREAGGASRYELEFVRKDGRRLPALVSGNPRFEDGRFVGMLAVFADISDRKRAEEALRDTTEQLRALVHAAPVGVTVVDLEGRVQLWNPAAQAMFRVSAEEILDTPLSSLRAPLEVENVETFMAMIQRVLAGETVSGTEVRAYRTDAVPLDVMVSAAPLRDSEGQIHAVMGVLADVSDRKRAEAALERHAREMSVLYETSLEVAETSDPMQIVQTVLTRAANLLEAPMGGVYLVEDTGRELELVVTHNLPSGLEGRSLLMGEGLSGKVALSGEAMAVNDYSTWEGRHAGKEGAGFRRMAGAPLRRGARVIGVINVIDDQRTDSFEADEVRILQLFADQAAIALENARLLEETRRRAAHLEAVTSMAAALRATRHRSEMMPVLLGRVQDLVGAQGTLLAMENRAAQEIVVPVASGAWSQLKGTRQNVGGGMFGEVMATGKAVMQVESGGEVWRRLPVEIQRMSAVALVPLVEQEEVVGLLGVGRTEPFGQAERSLLMALAEVVGNALHRAGVLETLEERVQIRTRELAEANERLTELDRLKSDFVSNVSHELRTPITNVLLYLDLLQQPGREERREAYLQVLRRESERLGHLIEDLLMLSRMDQAALKLNRELRALDPMLAEVVSAHRARAQAKGIDLTLEPNPEVPAVWIGYQQMIQVFNNLVGNAVAYTPNGGHVTLTSLVRERPEGGREIGARVRNDGPIIPAEDLPKLFQRFYRGKTGRESGESGTGLGLAICREIVDRHAGRIDVQSTPEDGTSFTVWLPVGGPA
jgi:PAS domain S-box-containing protein